ncbi:hypothetical protein [Tengunoibacter tsumagoiensis]|uniref:Uncharacterized protein n=1 Tax=Tengunoibacter tsumagoiensis TaxID=2014871 RepID=A0A401ZV92_9CHLR|nr:hypothetical protein [Tengunoibacter tsumagoiensis]GCE10835.1 hypothetical protein KTT_06940 [Tengunoibacter tsumagoiensis]
MESELEQHLAKLNKQQLLLLVELLVVRNAHLSAEIEALLSTLLFEDEEFNADKLTLHRSLPQQLSPPLATALYQEQIEGFMARLQQGVMPQLLFDELCQILQQAEALADQYEYRQALELFALTLDARLGLDHTILTALFDRALDEFMPVLDMLLSEASSLIMPHPDAEATPLLPEDLRQLWLQRIFSLWLKRIDAHQAEEHLPEMLLEMAWHEDVPLLQYLLQQELQSSASYAHSNIVDFSHQSRTRILEKFLKELPAL